MSKALEDMVNTFISVIGTHETNGDNVNAITAWYGENGSPWCDMTVSYCAYHSNNVQAVCFGYKHDYTVEHAQTFSDHGQWHAGATGIQRGDIVFFDWEGSNSIANIDHVGIVELVDTDGVHCIEGNIDNVCKRTVRHEDFIAGYGRPQYAPDPVVKPVVDLSVVRYAAEHATAAAGVTQVQNALAKLGFIGFTARGTFTAATKSAYAAYQRSLGYTGSGADGVPGIGSLTKLGANTGLFTVSA